MARYATLYQCFNFLAREKATLGFCPHPDDPRKNRMTIRVGGEVAAITYRCTEEIDLLGKLLAPICHTLGEHLEKVREAENV